MATAPGSTRATSGSPSTRRAASPDRPKILALDAALGACSAAVLADGAIRARAYAAMQTGQAEALMPMAADVMARSGLNYAELDAVAATVGPGTFTGVRIGLAAARGLALALGIPGIGVTTLEAVRRGIAERTRVLVALECKRAELAVQLFGPEGEALSEPALLAPESFVFDGPFMLAGDGAPRAAAYLPGAAVLDGPSLPDAAVVARIAAERLAAGLDAPLRPLYLRAPSTT
jgi:tRNA threonylcarbamoyladenosine biosynthesis protein TsaB